jgi:hypothetical protein
MKGSFGDKCVVIIDTKYPSSLQCANHERDRLQLRAGLGDAFLINSKCLNIQVVREVLETTLVGDLGRKEEEPERDGWSVDLSGEDRGELANKFENRFDLRGPVIFEVFTVLVSAAELDRRRDDSGNGKTHTVSTSLKVPPRGL